MPPLAPLGRTNHAGGPLGRGPGGPL